MPVTLFYSWQSDLSPDVTRDFIRDALVIAIGIVNRDLAIEEALRITSDTQDEPGHPSIFATILTKIDQSAVFVPDVSIVAEISGEGRDKGKGVFNPNVAIEYGYALKALGPERMIPVMNTAFGGLRKLPFDMAHRRGPIRFNLLPGADAKNIEKEKNALGSRLIQIQ